MAFFAPQSATLSPRHSRIYTLYELAHTAVDFIAAILFLVGSILFFYPKLENPAIWCFVIGSAFFALKPTLRIVRELHYLTLGE